MILRVVGSIGVFAFSKVGKFVSRPLVEINPLLLGRYGIWRSSPCLPDGEGWHCGKRTGMGGEELWLKWGFGRRSYKGLMVE